MATSEQPDLLFLDTFSHDTSEELNLDLVQFPKSVYVREIRIIPLGARVEGEFPGGVRLGATNPTKFHIDFFVNDLSKPGAATFEPLGSLDYCQNGEIHVQCSTCLDNPSIPTDGLVLKGWYTTITLAVYGNLSQLDRDKPPPGAAPPAAPATPARDPAPPAPAAAPPADWGASIPAYAGAAADPAYPPHDYPEPYDPAPYRADYYDQKEGRYADAEWDARASRERSPRSAERRRRSADRRSRASSRRRSRSRDYRSRSRSADWDRASRRRRRDASYDQRSQSYDQRSASYDRRSPYDRRAPSYDRKRGSPRRSPRRSYSRSPSREDGRRRRSPPSPAAPARADDADFDRGAKQIPRVEFYHQSYRHKPPIRSPSQEPGAAAASALVTVPLVDAPPPPPPAAAAAAAAAEQFEPILSDEDICDEPEPPPDADADADDCGALDDVVPHYNPLKEPWASPRPAAAAAASFDELCDISPDLFKIWELTRAAGRRFLCSTFAETDNAHREDWVHQCEQAAAALAAAGAAGVLRAVCAGAAPELRDVRDLLLTFARIGLDFELALAQRQPTYKIRHMKCGIRLAEAWCAHRHAADAAALLLREGLDLPLLLLEMYAKEYMALSIRLMILKALSACLSSRAAVERFLQPAPYPVLGPAPARPLNGYQTLVALMQTGPLARVKFAVGALIKKLNMYELCGKLRELALSLHAAGPGAAGAADAELAAAALDELVRMLRARGFPMSQPRRFLPGAAQFHVPRESCNAALLDFFEIHRTLEVCVFLLTSPATAADPVLASPVHELLHELVHSEEGLEHLHRRPALGELVFRTLIQPLGAGGAGGGELYLHDLSGYSEPQLLALELAHRLRALRLLRDAAALQAARADENELIDRLQALYCLSFGNVGKTAVADVIAAGDNAECLVEVFERELRRRGDSPSKQRSPAKGYAAELLALAVRCSPHVPFLRRYAARLLAVAKEHERFEPSVSSVLQETAPYLTPAAAPGDALAECVEVLRSRLELAPDLPGELTTALRLLAHSCLPPRAAPEEFAELQYKYNVLQLFSLDGAAHVTALLDRLAAHFEQPSMHTAFFASLKGLQLAQLLLPALRLLDEMLARVVRCRGAQFRDLTAAPALLKTYGIAKAFPAGCVGHRTAARAAEAAVRALLAYSQPCADDAADGESVRRGPWTSLCAEVLDYTMTAPHTFAPGLLVFSELLPLPLPLHAAAAPAERELADAVNERRLWSAHLHALSAGLLDMIQVICVSTHRPVVHMLRRVCVQVADLAPNTAATVAAAALGAVTRELRDGEPASASAARVLGFLACLVAHAPVKCAVLAAAHAAAAAAPLQAALCGVLGAAHAGPEHAAAQEYAALTLAGLCDAEVSLAPADGPAEALAGALPGPALLAALLDASAAGLAAAPAAAAACSVLRAYFVLTEHEYGFQQFREFAGRRREALGAFFAWLVEGAGEDRAECLGLYLDLVRTLREEAEGAGAAGAGGGPRRGRLAPAEVADMVGYTPPAADHPALTLEDVLKERNADEETRANAQLLLACLTAPPAPAPAAAPAPAPPAPAPLRAQFAARARHAAAAAADERLTATYWLTAPAPADDDVNDSELVTCDVLELANALLAARGGGGGGAGGAGGALAASVRRLTGSARPPPPQPAGAGAYPGAVVPRRDDAFRSRPPNTSRPPSLHVDTFTALHHAARGLRRGAAAPHHYRQLRGRGAWEAGAPQHGAHLSPAAPYMMGGGGGGGGGWGRAGRGPRHRTFMR